MTPFDGKCHNLQTSFFSLIFAKILLDFVLTKVTDTQTDRAYRQTRRQTGPTDRHTEMDKPLANGEILQIFSIMVYDYISRIELIKKFLQESLLQIELAVLNVLNETPAFVS